MDIRFFEKEYKIRLPESLSYSESLLFISYSIVYHSHLKSSSHRGMNLYSESPIAMISPLFKMVGISMVSPLMLILSALSPGIR